MNRNKSIVLFILIATLGPLMVAFGLPDSLDSRLFYSSTEAASYLNSLSPEKVRIYFINELADLLLIACYSSLLWLQSLKLFSSKALGYFVALSPGAFDLIETSTILYYLKYALPTSSVFSYLGVATSLKWSFGLVSALFIATSYIKIRMSGTSR